MTPNRLAISAVVVLLTLVGFFQFPGHTFLYSDAQIYLPVLEHLWDDTVLAKDLVASRPHVAFSIYDEVALALRWLTGAEFQPILIAQQWLFRALGLLGVYLIAAALGLPWRPSLLVAAVFSLGATISGPAVLIFEYEPIPRGYAAPLLLLAVGLVAHSRFLLAGLSASLAFLYHGPTTWPFWGVYFCLVLWPGRPEVMKRHIRGLLPLLGAVLLLLLLSRLQRGVTEPQLLWTTIDPELENLQRMRASYNWVSVWAGNWIWHYLFLCAVSLAAFLRLRRFLAGELRCFLVGLPLMGLLGMGASYLLLEQWKWALAPQLQPARALLFVTAVTLVSASMAGVAAGRAKQFPESLLWLVLAYAIPASPRVLQVLLPDLGDTLIRRRVLVVLGLAVLTACAARLEARGRWPAWVVWALALLAPFFVIPQFGKLRNYPDLDHPELTELASWARSNTPKEAVFLFPDAGRELYPGIFRGRSLRAVYVDWKAGGQVNFLKTFAGEWWARWQQTMAPKFDPARPPSYSGLGIDYLVLGSQNRLAGRQPAFENARYLVYPAAR